MVGGTDVVWKVQREGHRVAVQPVESPPAPPVVDFDHPDLQPQGSCPVRHAVLLLVPVPRHLRRCDLHLDRLCQDEGQAHGACHNAAERRRRVRRGERAVNGIHWTELIVFVVLFLLVTVLGFMAAKWKAGETLEHLDEWGLGGRKFGSWITWFLIGGDLYTAYTFVAVPALMFSAGATGFFALPYTIIAYPIVFLPLLRLWSVSRSRGYVTPADFVRGRYGSSVLALLVAITGIVATMPYIALQLVGLESVLRTLGLNGSGIFGHLPLLIAFVVLAVYTYKSGLRAPALIAFVKAILIYIVILVAVISLPSKLGGWGTVFAAADKKFTAAPTATNGILLNTNNQLQYATLALGSALALFLYPHSVTGVLASRGRKVLKRNRSALPASSWLLGLLALLG